MNFTKVISSKIVEAVQSVKFLRMGKSDVRENKTVSPYGIDSNPIADMIGLYAPTGSDGENVLIGYINKNAIATPGETRFFSTDTDGVEKAYIYLKGNGDIHFNGDEDNLVRFSPNKGGFDASVNKINEIITNWNALCNTYVPGSPVTVGLPPTLISLVISPSTASINDAKIDALKCAQDD